MAASFFPFVPVAKIRPISKFDGWSVGLRQLCGLMRVSVVDATVRGWWWQLSLNRGGRVPVSVLVWLLGGAEFLIEEDGARRGIRTPDQLGVNEPLYH